MYAVIHTGGKQYRVAEGQRLDVERLVPASESSSPRPPRRRRHRARHPAQLVGASVTARVVGEAKGPKIHGFTYKNKTNQRKRWGHRQHYTTIEITGISKG